MALKGVGGHWRALEEVEVQLCIPPCPLAVPSIVAFFPLPPLSCPHVVFSAVPSCVLSCVPLVPFSKEIRKKTHDCDLGVGLDPLRCGVGGLPGSTWAVCLDPRGCGLNGRPASTRMRFRRPTWIPTGAVWAVWIHAGAVWAVVLDPRGCGRAVCVDPRGCGLGGQPGSTEARLELQCGLGWSLEGVGGG